MRTVTEGLAQPVGSIPHPKQQGRVVAVGSGGGIEGSRSLIHQGQVAIGGIAMENARVLFDSLVAHGVRLVETWITEQRAETVFLDFKEKSRPDGSARPGDDDKNNYARALSGFANSAGGILIWGVADHPVGDARAAYERRPIANVSAFVRALEALLPEGVTRPVEGVRNVALPLQDAPDSGYVVTYVPESPMAPHRAEFKLHQYFKRVGDSFRVMEHYELEDMYGRRQRPHLSVEVGHRPTSQGQDEHRYALSLRVTNDGRAMCRFWGIDFEFPNEALINKENFRVPIYDAGGVAKISYRSGINDAPLFPGESVMVWPNNYKAGHFNYRIDSPIADAHAARELRLDVFADSAPMQQVVIPFRTCHEF